MFRNAIARPLIASRSVRIEQFNSHTITRTISTPTKLSFSENKSIFPIRALFSTTPEQPEAQTPEIAPVAPETPETTQTSEKAPETPETSVVQDKAAAKAEKKAKKKKEKKAQAVAEIDEDHVELKKRLRKERRLSVYTGNGSEIDPKSDDLNDEIILSRIKEVDDTLTDLSLAKMKDKLIKNREPVTDILLFEQYKKRYGIPNPYVLLRVTECMLKYTNDNHLLLSNKDFLDRKFNTLTRMAASQKMHKLFPDIMEKFTPTINLHVRYHHSLAGSVSVFFGNTIPAELTENPPTVEFQGKKDCFYTLVMIDAKNERYLRHFPPTIHWLVANIPANGNIKEGEELVEYLGSVSPFTSESSRMSFVLLRQQFGRISFVSFPRIVSSSSIEDREKFDLKNFARQYDLLPRGLSFFGCQYDWSVKERYAKLGVGEPIYVSRHDLQRREASQIVTDAIRSHTAKKFTWPSLKKH